MNNYACKRVEISDMNNNLFYFFIPLHPDYSFSKVLNESQVVNCQSEKS